MTRRLHQIYSRAEEGEPTINLTPLIDVVFVVLIMFIMVAPLLELDRVQLADAGNQQTDHVSAAQESSPISIHVLRDNKIMFNQREVSIKNLPNLLKQAKVQHPKVRPQVFHDKEAYFGTYQAVKNAIEEAGFEQMDIVLKPSS